MSFSTTSRYYGLPVLRAERGPFVTQRPVPPLPGPEGSVLHTLSTGETLEILARHYYGHEDLWWRIADANPARHPADWQIGEIVVVPPPSAARTRTR